MQTNSFKNLIVSLYYANSNNNIKHYYIKHNNKVKHIKIKNSLKQMYNSLYKNYNCNLQQLNFIQFAYNTNNIKHNLSFKYCISSYNKLKQCLNAM